MIPKVIHYIWVGKSPLPELTLRCIKSWQDKCPGYEIKLWNEDNLNIEDCLFAKQAYENRKYGFVSDYFRLKVVFEHGGIYLDTDVEVLKPFDDLLGFNAFFGFENEEYIATGLGFGAVKGCAILRELMKGYENVPFQKADGSFDMMPCPQRDTAVLNRLGLKSGKISQEIDGVKFLPAEYLSPINFTTGISRVTEKTISIHHYMGSWLSEEELKNIRVRYFLIRLFGGGLGKKVNNLYVAYSEMKIAEFLCYVCKKVIK